MSKLEHVQCLPAQYPDIGANFINYAAYILLTLHVISGHKKTASTDQVQFSLNVCW